MPTELAIDESAAAATTTRGAANGFTARMYGAICAAEANCIASPLSIFEALAMVREGTRGNTRAELDRALGLEPIESTSRDAVLRGGLRALRAELQAVAASGVTLDVANRAFLEHTLAIEPSFRQALDVGFRAPFEDVDFVGGAEAARARINGWVEEQTHERIEDLLPPGSIDGNTRLVLANAIYFLGTWQTQFDAANTRPRTFTRSNGATAEVPMMNARRRARFGVLADGTRALELPYAGGRASILLVLPPTRDGLSAWARELTAPTIESVVGALDERDNVEIVLPRFRVAPTESIDLIATLQGLGVRDLFDDGAADLTGIARTDPRLVVSGVFHKGFIELDERGTEAAAATGVVIAVRGMRVDAPEPPRFIADRPFAFMLRDRETGTILFTGRVEQP